MKPRQQPTFGRSSSLLIAVSFAMSPSAAHAAALTWDGNGATPDVTSAAPARISQINCPTMITK